MASVAGRSRYILRSSIHRVMPGDTILVSPGDIHTTISEPGQTWRFINVNLNTRLLTAFAAENGSANTSPLFFSQPVLHHPPLQQHLVNLHGSMTRGGSKLYQEEIMEQILGCLLGNTRNRISTVLRLTPSRRAVERARELLDASYAAKISLRQLSAAAGLSPFHLSRVFVKQIGLPLHAYQIQLRVLAAKRMLGQGYSVAVAAKSTGFTDASHLNRVFARTYGITPGRYKNSKNVQAGESTG